MLSIKNLTASINGTPVLMGIDLEMKAGEIHAIMGPNGSGKSTLGKVLAGHPSYEVTGGEVLFEGQNLFDLQPDARARAGIFLGFQHPIEVPGVSNASFLRLAYNKKAEAALRSLGYKVAVNKVVAVEISDRIGAGAEIGALLGTAIIDVEYCYGSSSGTGTALLVFKTNNNKKAYDTLK